MRELAIQVEIPLKWAAMQVEFLFKIRTNGRPQKTVVVNQSCFKISVRHV